MLSFFSPPRHSKRSVFSGFHEYKPQARKSHTAEQAREYFCTAPSRKGENHSLFNILLELCLCQSNPAVFQPNFSGQEVATSSGWRSPVAFGSREIKIMTN